ncbi:MAG: hypothetical protein ACI9C2_001378 [Gammaproteobacteria bacterium]|jgi:hypothetical protein
MKMHHSIAFGLVLMSLLGLDADGRTQAGGEASVVPGGKPSGALVIPKANSQRLEFVENLGQWDSEFEFIARGVSGDHVGYSYGVDSRGISLQYAQGAFDQDLARGGTGEARSPFADPRLADSARDGGHSVVFRLDFVGGDPGARIQSSDFGSSLYHYRIGADPERWKSGLRGAGRLRVEDVWPGIDVVFREGAEGLEYDLEVDAGARLDQARFRLEGPDGEQELESGRLRLVTEWGALSQSAPVSFVGAEPGQPDSDSGSQPTASSFELLDDGTFGFVASDRSLDQRLVVDPGVSWASYIGGSHADRVYDAVYVDGEHLLVSGSTQSSNFPITPGFYPWADTKDGYEGFVSQVNTTTGQLDFSLFVGGTGDESVGGILRDVRSGDFYCVGYSDSADFPTTPGVVVPNPSAGAFFMRFSADATQLRYSTFWGNPLGMEGAKGGAVAGDGGLIIHGVMNGELDQHIVSPGAMLSVPAYQDPAVFGWETAWAAKLSPDGASVMWSTFLPGPAHQIAMGPDGSFVTRAVMENKGLVTTPSAYQASAPVANIPANYIQRIRGNGTELLAATYFGTEVDQTTTSDMAIGADGSVHLTGQTRAITFPATVGSLSTTLLGFDDGFVARLSSDLSSLEAATYLGTTSFSPEIGYGIHVDASGVVTVHLRSFSGGFYQTPGSYVPINPSGLSSRHLVRLAPDLGHILFSTYWAVGSQYDLDQTVVFDLAVGNYGDAMLVGDTQESEMETSPGSLPGKPNPLMGPKSGFMKAMDMLPTGVTKYGSSSSDCSDEIYLGVTNMPVSGGSNFSIFASGAVPGAQSFLLAGLGRDIAGTPIAGVTSHVSFNHPYWLFSQPSPGPTGFQEFPLNIPAGLSGLKFYCQTVYYDQGPCHPTGGWSSSNALRLELQ